MRTRRDVLGGVDQTGGANTLVRVEDAPVDLTDAYYEVHFKVAIDTTQCRASTVT